MGERTSYATGTHSWVDLATDDTEAAERFCTELLGWDDVQEGDAGEGRTDGMIVVGDKTAAGLFRSENEMPPHWRQAGLMSHWLPYFAVEDTETALEKAGGLGGRVMAGPYDVPGGGRIGVIQDPQGAVFAVYAGESDD